MKTLFSIPPQQIRVIPNGIEEEFFITSTDRTTKTTPSKIGYLGQLSPKKRTFGFLHAFKNFPNMLSYTSQVQIWAPCLTFKIQSHNFPKQNNPKFFYGLLEGQNRIQFCKI